jgi:hypothetical protein
MAKSARRNPISYVHPLLTTSYIRTFSLKTPTTRVAGAIQPWNIPEKNPAGLSYV